MIYYRKSFLLLRVMYRCNIGQIDKLQLFVVLQKRKQLNNIIFGRRDGQQAMGLTDDTNPLSKLLLEICPNTLIVQLIHYLSVFRIFPTMLYTPVYFFCSAIRS